MNKNCIHMLSIGTRSICAGIKQRGSGDSFISGPRTTSMNYLFIPSLDNDDPADRRPNYENQFPGPSKHKKQREI